LLIEVETPIISLKHKILVSVKNGDEMLMNEEIVNRAKIAVPRASDYIDDSVNMDSMEYETCFKIVVDGSAEG
jgi:hypothetical protein